MLTVHPGKLQLSTVKEKQLKFQLLFSFLFFFFRWKVLFLNVFFFFNLGFDKRCQRTFVLLETSALMSFCINETRRETAAVKKIKRSESNVSEQIYQWAHTLIVWLCLFVRLITSRCQLQGSGTAGLKTAPATRNMPGSREVPAGPACLWVSGASGTSEAH